MNDAQLLIARLRTKSEIDAKFKLVDELRSRCIQKVQELQRRGDEAKVVDILDANAKKLENLGKQLLEAEPAFTELAEKFKNASANISDTSGPTFEQISPLIVRSLERLQSMFETELLMLDDFIDQLEGRRSS